MHVIFSGILIVKSIVFLLTFRVLTRIQTRKKNHPYQLI
jgi:hypothetical protein